MKNVLILIGLSLLLNACGEFSYKRGGSARDIENAHKACRGVSESDFSQCLEKQGWEVQKFDDQELFAVATVEDNRMQGQPKQTSSSSTESKQSNESESKTSENKETISKPEEPDPMQAYKINSWWKFGASDKKLMSDMESCTSKLGADHNPDMKNHMYTRAFIVCMHSEGWKALKAVK